MSESEAMRDAKAGHAPANPTAPRGLASTRDPMELVADLRRRDEFPLLADYPAPITLAEMRLLLGELERHYGAW
jgi:hypothetical protein